MHAFTHAPELLVLQVNRFLHTDRSIKKTQQRFQLQGRIDVPTFTDHEGTVEQMCGGVLRTGKVVTAGHYQTFYFPGADEDIWPIHLVHDDGQSAHSHELLPACLPQKWARLVGDNGQVASTPKLDTTNSFWKS